MVEMLIRSPTSACPRGPTKAQAICPIAFARITVDSLECVQMFERHDGKEVVVT
jgi:hypothetical protein